jgi:ElaA protein
MLAGVTHNGPHRSNPAAGIVWQWARLNELSVTDLYAVMVARQRAFTVEQNCAYLDADGLDAYAWHLIGWPGNAAHQDLAAYLRVVDPGHRFAEPSIGRVVTAAEYRRIGLGRALMLEGLARTGGIYPGVPVRIAAQYRLETFYASLGFRTVSSIFEEDGIPHVEMLHAANDQHGPARTESPRQFG